MPQCYAFKVLCQLWFLHTQPALNKAKRGGYAVAGFLRVIGCFFSKFHNFVIIIIWRSRFCSSSTKCEMCNFKNWAHTSVPAIWDRNNKSFPSILLRPLICIRVAGAVPSAGNPLPVTFASSSGGSQSFPSQLRDLMININLKTS